MLTVFPASSVRREIGALRSRLHSPRCRSSRISIPRFAVAQSPSRQGEEHRLERRAPAGGGRHARLQARERVVGDHPSLVDDDDAIGQAPAVDQHVAPIGTCHAGDHRHRRRLAGAVRAEQSDELAALDGERHIVDGDQRAEALPQAPDLQHREVIFTRPRPSGARFRTNDRFGETEGSERGTNRLGVVT